VTYGQFSLLGNGVHDAEELIEFSDDLFDGLQTTQADEEAFEGNPWSLVQELVPNHKRAIAASVYLMIFNLIGLGLGPLFVGMLSDVYIPHLGDASLRWSMISVLMVSVLGIVFYLRTAGSVLNDIRLSQRR
jgi:MFS family permease